MTATTTALVPLQPVFTDAERLALAGFLAGYRGLTREAYALDLRSSPPSAGRWPVSPAAVGVAVPVSAPCRPRPRGQSGPFHER